MSKINKVVEYTRNIKIQILFLYFKTDSQKVKLRK